MIKREQQAVPLAGASGRIRGGKDRINLFSGHESEDWFDGFLLWNCQNPMANTDEIDSARFSQHEPHEGSDGGKTYVSRSGRVATSALQMIEKSQDALRID